MLSPNDIDGKSGQPVKDVLVSKHPPMREPGPSAMQDYESVPDFLDLDITQDTVELVAPHLSGSAGPCGLDSVEFKHMLIRHG